MRSNRFIKPLASIVLALALLAGTTACSTSTPSLDLSDKSVGQLVLPEIGTDLAGYGQATVADKEEVIYASLDYSGKVDQAYTVNHFKLTSAGYLTDYGNYRSVSNLSNTYPITLEGNSVAIAAQKGDFYYQGDTDNLLLPWQIDISYSLDGQAVAAKDASTLAGKSGRLQISINTAQTASVDSSFYENYTLQVSMTIDAARSSNIDAPDATVVAAGGDRQINFTVLPGKNAGLAFAADVVDFEMPGISIAAVPFSMNFDLPDVSSMTGELDMLVSAISDLNNGASELDGGVAKLSGGINELAGAANQVSDGAAALGQGLAALDAGSAQIASGSAQFGSQLNTMASGADQLIAAQQAYGIFDSLDGTDPTLKPMLLQLLSGLSAASAGYNNPDPSTGLDSGIQAYTGGVSALASQYPALADSLAQLSGGAGQLNSGAAEMAAGTSKLASGTSQLYGGVYDMPQTMQSKINEFMASYDYSGFTPHSFLSADNTKVSLVQFVIKTPDINLPTSEPAAGEQSAEQTFWDRLTGLFS